MNEHKCLVTRYDPRDYILGINSPISLRGTGNPDWTGNCWFMERQKFGNFDNDCCIIYYGQQAFDAQMDRLISEGKVSKTILDWFALNGYMDAVNSSDGKPHFHTSERFVAYNTGNGFNGNAGQDPWIAMRTYGFIPWTDWPFDETIGPDHYFDKPPQALFDKGLLALAQIGGKNAIQYHWIYQGSDAPRSSIDAARMTAPLGFGVATTDGWNQTHPTPPVKGTPPNHGIMNTTHTADGEQILDHYLPFYKVFTIDYPIPQVIQGVLSIIPPVPSLPAIPTATVQQNPKAWSLWIASVSAWVQNWMERLSPMGRIKLNGASRSSRWPAFKKEFMKTHLPVCEVCGGTKGLNLHHLRPFHVFPELELDPENVVWLCNEKECHIRIGHLGNFQSINPSGKEDIMLWRDKIRERPMTANEIKTALSTGDK